MPPAASPFIAEPPAAPSASSIKSHSPLTSETSKKSSRRDSLLQLKLPGGAPVADLPEQPQLVERDEFHQALGAAKKEAGRDARHVNVAVHLHGKGKKQTATFTYSLNGKKLRESSRREGRYLLRTNLSGNDPAKLWEYYLQLTEIEQAFKELKGDLAVRPIHHQLEHRIHAVASNRK